MQTKNILIVEDDPDNQELLEEIISSYVPDYKFMSFDSGDKALEAAQKIPFDMVFMDMSIPKKNGYEVIKELRNTKNYQTVPIIALTAHTLKGMKERVLSSGFTEYLSKPCNPDIIINIIKNHLIK